MLESIFTEIIKVISPIGGPLSVLLLGLYWLERQNRIELQKERDQLLERVLKAMQTEADNLRDFRELLRAKRRGGTR